MYVFLFSQRGSSKRRTNPLAAMLGGGGQSDDDIKIDMRESTFYMSYNDLSKLAKDKKNPVSLITWANNIERDGQYAQFYPNFQALRSMIIFQQVAPIRKNVKFPPPAPPPAHVAALPPLAVRLPFSVTVLSASIHTRPPP